jgi:hypothetical protein
MKNLSRFAWLALMTSTAVPASAQDDYRNGLFIELGGPGYLYSINYEHKFSTQWIVRVGVSVIDAAVLCPVTMGKVYGVTKHHFELAAGIIYGNHNKYERYSGTYIGPHPILLGTAFAGYRYQEHSNPFFFRAGFTPVVDFRDEDRISPVSIWGGISFGIRF